MMISEDLIRVYAVMWSSTWKMLRCERNNGGGMTLLIGIPGLPETYGWESLDACSD